jgi:protein-tyrosine phosphatase
MDRVAATVRAFVDIHCHLLPGLDDGPQSPQETLAMARLAVRDGIGTIVATPHQLGSFAHIRASRVRDEIDRVTRLLSRHQLPLEVLPGADVRVEPGLAEQLVRGDVLTLADRGRHVLLELPHELYFPLEPVIDELRAAGLVGILSHPERNQGLLANRDAVAGLVEHGCLMQVTAGSLTGDLGSQYQRFGEWMLGEGLVHFVASDAHGARSRRPRLRPAFERVRDLTDPQTAVDLFQVHPRQVSQGQPVAAGRRRTHRARPGHWFGWMRAS